jgi:predicted metal-dependent hydrolase
VLEVAWRRAKPDERDFFQGLVHVAVAWYQAGRRRHTACGRQLQKAALRLSGYGGEHRGVDLRALNVQIGQALRQVDRGSLDLPTPLGRTGGGNG